MHEPRDAPVFSCGQNLQVTAMTRQRGCSGHGWQRRGSGRVRGEGPRLLSCGRKVTGNASSRAIEKPHSQIISKHGENSDDASEAVEWQDTSPPSGAAASGQAGSLLQS